MVQGGAGALPESEVAGEASGRSSEERAEDGESTLTVRSIPCYIHTYMNISLYSANGLVVVV